MHQVKLRKDQSLVKKIYNITMVTLYVALCKIE